MPQYTRKSHDYIILIFKGMAMMAAELVPGISAASVTKLTGLYSEGIDTLSQVSIRSTVHGIKNRRLAWWYRLNVSFMIALLFGALLSLFSLARLIFELQQETPILIRSFLIGFLSIALAMTARKIARWDIINTSAFVIGGIVTLFINSLSVSNPATFSPIMAIVAGLLVGAIVLFPGVTVLTVLQFFIINLQEITILHVTLFLISVTIGVLFAARGLASLYKAFKNTTSTLLLGCIAGGLLRLWPWQEAQTQFASATNISPINNQLISPSHYALLHGDAQSVLAAILLVAGCCIALLFYVLWGKTES